jgi:hypothetical protein
MHAGVPFYGAVAETSGVPSIMAALLIHFAENDDDRINAMWPVFETALTAARMPHEMHKYSWRLSRSARQIAAPRSRLLESNRLHVLEQHWAASSGNTSRRFLRSYDPYRPRRYLTHPAGVPVG